MNYVNFEVVSENDLFRVHWRFYLLQDALILDLYQEYRRDSKRHGFKHERVWSRLMQSDNTMAEIEVPFTDEIAVRAKAEFIKAVTETISVQQPDEFFGSKEKYESSRRTASPRSR